MEAGIEYIKVAFTETRPDKTTAEIAVYMPPNEGRQAQILEALGYRFRAQLANDIVLLSIHGPVRPGLTSGPVEAVGTCAAPNDGHTYKAAAQMCVIQSFRTVFPSVPEGVN